MIASFEDCFTISALMISSTTSRSSSASRWLASNVTLLTAALFVCASPSSRAVDALEETFDEVYALDSDGQLSIRNTDGSIRIYAGDVSEIHVYATKKAYTAARLNGISIEVKSTPKLLTIDTHFPPPPSRWSFRDRSGTVEYTLIVPNALNVSACELSAGEILIEGLQEGRANAHLVNGWLAAHNSFVDLDLAIDNGRLDVAYDWWQAAKNFIATARSVDGNIRALFPPDASLTVSAQSKQGRVANNFDSDDGEHVTQSDQAQLTIGSGGGAQVRLRSETGNIRIDHSY